MDSFTGFPWFEPAEFALLPTENAIGFHGSIHSPVRGDKN